MQLHFRLARSNCGSASRSQALELNPQPSFQFHSGLTTLSSSLFNLVFLLCRWLSDVQEGIYDMLSLFIDLIVARLKHDPLPLSMLQILAMVGSCLLKTNV